MTEPRERGMPTFAPNWYADPAGRHRLRFYDGARWTEHVSDGTRSGIDPLPGSGPAAAHQQSQQQAQAQKRQRPGCMALFVGALAALVTGALVIGGAYLVLRGNDPPGWLKIVTPAIVGIVFFSVLRGFGWPPPK